MGLPLKGWGVDAPEREGPALREEGREEGFEVAGEETLVGTKREVM
jgi:hypothetical protein